MHINWNYLSKNPNAIEILQVNQKKINWRTFSENPAIFKKNYKNNELTFQSYFETFKFDALLQLFKYWI
jgi:hypothetical protein